jgi:hypothetical protein
MANPSFTALPALPVGEFRLLAAGRRGKRVARQHRRQPQLADREPADLAIELLSGRTRCAGSRRRATSPRAGSCWLRRCAARRGLPGDVALIVWRGAIYTLGALIYLVRRPDPWPTVFGHHEVFHVAIIVASSCHFIAIARLAM